MRLSRFGLPDPLGPVDRALAPAPNPKRIAALVPLPLAHRGLHGAGRIENSRAAFVEAIGEGHGIELDVQASRDGDAFVFHDYELDRLTGEQGALAERSTAELKRIRLTGSDETIPTLTDALQLIAGQVPLLIEVKAPDRKVGALCLSVLRALDGYRGPVGVMSFNPEVGRWFSIHGPRITRGLVVTEQDKQRLRGAARRRLALWRARPDFLAYDIRDLPSRMSIRARGRGIPVFTWTCRSDDERARAAQHADQIIYENS
jgi:glycerophosphoryl diester phosphodiesterase